MVLNTNTHRTQFQSTLSMRRATISAPLVWFSGFITIHARVAVCDRRTRCTSVIVWLFQSTLSMRRATVQLDIFVRFLRRKPAA